MNTVLLVVRRSLQRHLLSTCVTALSVALACGLLMAVFVIQTQARDAMTGGATRYDAVLGARGSQLQLVLNTVFHVDVSPGNIPYKLYTAIKNDSRVAQAVPYAVGDNYRGFRIVATMPEAVASLGGKHDFKVEDGGRVFNPYAHEAVIGSFAADKTGLTIGSVFNAYHGVVFEEKMKHPDQFTVVGILQPTNTPADRAIWVPLDSFYRLSGHVLRGDGSDFRAKKGEGIIDDHKELSAVMIKFKSPAFGFAFEQMINRQGKAATLAWPIEKIMADFFNKIGWFYQVLTLLAYLIAVIASGAILAAIYNSMNERRREFAILRALGAGRRHVFMVVIMESMVIAAIGIVIGFFVCAAILVFSGGIIRAGTGIVIDIFRFHPVFVAAPCAIIVLGFFSGIVPAMKMYKQDVVSNLGPIT